MVVGRQSFPIGFWSLFRGEEGQTSGGEGKVKSSKHVFCIWRDLKHLSSLLFQWNKSTWQHVDCWAKNMCILGGEGPLKVRGQKGGLHCRHSCWDPTGVFGQFQSSPMFFGCTDKKAQNLTSNFQVSRLADHHFCSQTKTFLQMM